MMTGPWLFVLVAILIVIVAAAATAHFDRLLRSRLPENGRGMSLLGRMSYRRLSLVYDPNLDAYRVYDSSGQLLDAHRNWRKALESALVKVEHQAQQSALHGQREQTGEVPLA